MKILMASYVQLVTSVVCDYSHKGRPLHQLVCNMDETKKKKLLLPELFESAVENIESYCVISEVS